MDIFSVFTLCGGLAFFLYGMTVMSKSLEKMAGGKLERIRFKYTGPSIEAVLDRLPTAEIISQDENGWTVEAEVFGKGIEMWMRSQGSYIVNEIIHP